MSSPGMSKKSATRASAPPGGGASPPKGRTKIQQDKDKKEEEKAGRVLRKYIKQRSMDALLEDVDMLKFLFPHHISQLNQHERAIALIHLFLTGFSDNIVNYLLEHINADILNCVIETGKYQGASMLFYLCYLPRGKALLLMNNALLARLVRPEALNAIVTIGEFKGQSPAFHLLLTVDQDSLLLQETLQLHLSLHPSTLNHIITTVPPGPYQDLSIVFLLASSPHGRNLLQLHDNHLCGLLTPASVNHVVHDARRVCESDSDSGGNEHVKHPLSGQSAALLLLRCSARDVFTSCFLRHSLLTPSSLSATARDPSLFGETVAFWLSKSAIGVRILQQNKCFLGSRISEDTMNMRVSVDHHHAAGESVAFHLSNTSAGVAVLAHNNYKLKSMIHANTLNHRVENELNLGESVALRLAMSKEGLSLLRHDDYRLMNFVTEETFSHRASSATRRGHSVAFWLSASLEGKTILSRNNFSFANMITAPLLNNIIESDEHVGESIAFWLTYHDGEDESDGKSGSQRRSRSKSDETLGLQILCHRNDIDECSLLDLIEQDTLNCLVATPGRQQGLSVAYNLACTLFSLAPYSTSNLTDQQRSLTCLLAMTHQHTLNHVVAGDRYNAGYSVAYWLASSELGILLLTDNNAVLFNNISEETLNSIIQNDSSSGSSVAFAIVRTEAGRQALAAADYKVAKLLTAKSLNSIVQRGPDRGLSVAFWLASSDSGQQLLEAHDFRMAALLEEETLNNCSSGSSVACCLAAGGEGGLSLLCWDNCRFLDLLSVTTLNHCCSGHGESVAFWLASSAAGLELLCLNDCAMADSIDAGALNHVIQNSVTHIGNSVAFQLSRTETGMNLLCRNDFRLGRLLSEEVLNTIVFTQRECMGTSVAFFLSGCELGLQLFSYADHCLSNKIHKDCFNCVIEEPSSRYKGSSVAYRLSVSEVGRYMLSQAKGRLAGWISANTLNSSVFEEEEGAEEGRGCSIACWLATDEAGLYSLQHDHCRLLGLITAQTLNSIVVGGRNHGLSLALCLAATGRGRELLCHQQFRLGNMLNEHTLNHSTQIQVQQTLHSSVDGEAGVVDHQVLRTRAYQGVSVAFLLAGSHDQAGRALLFRNNDNDNDNDTKCSSGHSGLGQKISEEGLNHIVEGEGTSCNNRGLSVAFHLASTTDGLDLLRANKCHLLGLLNENSINSIVQEGGVHQGLSVAFLLAQAQAMNASADTGDEGHTHLLTWKKYKIGKLISPLALNHVAECAGRRGESVAYWLASSRGGRELLMRKNLKLGSKISVSTMNVLLESERRRGESVVFQLSLHDKKQPTIGGGGHQLLAERGHMLLAKVQQQGLSAIVSAEEGGHCGESAAFHLSSSASGRDLLSHNNFQLAGLIDAAALNSIVQSDANGSRGLSTALNLCKSTMGISILSCEEYRLVGLINADTLNHIIGAEQVEGTPEEIEAALVNPPPHQGECAAYYLCCNEDRLPLLFHDNRRLANMLTTATLEHILFIANITGRSSATDFANMELERKTAV